MDYEQKLIEAVELITKATEILDALRTTPVGGMPLDRRALSVAITNAETANLWAAFSRPGNA